jgi:hypothetical protein
MRACLIAVLFAIVNSIVPASAADGCGPGCHNTPGGACVVNGWVPARTYGTSALPGLIPVLPVLQGINGDRKCTPAFSAEVRLQANRRST